MRGWNRAGLVCGVLAMLTGGACGTRVPAGTEFGSQRPAPILPPPAADAGPSSGSDAQSPSAAALPTSRVAATPSPIGQTATTTDATARKLQADDQRSVPGPGGSVSPPAPAPGALPQGDGRTTAPSSAATKRAPLLLASVGTYSGPASSTSYPVLQGALLWVKWANSRGGVGGRTISLRVYDDGGDPARHRAQVQEAVEAAHVIGFLSNVEPLTGEQSIDYVTSRRVPIIGISLAEPWAYRSPMYFPQGPAADALLQASLQTWADATLATGKVKFGSLVCVEAQFCRDGERFFKQHAAAYGFRPVYSGQTSLANPDYTADCLSARNAGVEILAVMLDTASIARVANSCGRQGYRPRYVIVAATQTDAFKDNEFLDGITLASPVFPYFSSGTPARDEFQIAKRTFGASITPSVGVAQGWAAGKMVERATRDLPEPATNEALLSALWSFRDESLGGLTPPLTFLPEKTVSPRACWYPIATRAGSWVTLSDALRCAD